MNNLPIRQDARGNSQFVLKLSYQLRVRLRAASQSTGASQQAIVRGAISTYLESLHSTPERSVLIPWTEPEAANPANEDQSTQITPEVVDQVDQTIEDQSSQITPEIANQVDQTAENPPSQSTPEVVDQPAAAGKRRKRSR
jgi:hypothetical protein